MIDWHVPSALWWVVVPFVAWRIVVRLRRLLVRQRFSKARQLARAIGLGLLVVAVGAIAFEDKASFGALCAGLVVGSLLGALGIRLTRFDPRDDGIYFEPNKYLGLALALLLLARVGWRLWSGSTDVTEGWTVAEFVHNASTMLLFGLFTAHIVVYALGVIYWTRRCRLKRGRPAD